MVVASIIVGAIVSVSNDGGASYVTLGRVVSTATTVTVDACHWCGRPRGLCWCFPVQPDTRLTISTAVDAHLPTFGWYRALERAQPSAKLLTRCTAVVHRFWRRLRGHDALQVRRFKRRRFVQALAGVSRCA
jgi:hypothetical protein